MEEIRKKYNLSLILLHGSKAEGKTHERSDTDIAIVRKSSKDGLILPDLVSDIMANLHDNKVDVADITNANPLLLFAVVKKAKLLAGSESDFEKLKLKAFHKYSDYKPYLKKEADFVRERIATYA